jgi:lipopolysaccharide assembly outer membrane protein LptD (OstA)
MKKRPLISFLLLLLFAVPLAKAQLAGFGQTPVEINAGQTRFENGLAVGEGNVEIRYGTTSLYCDYAQYNPDTRDVLLRGNVRIYHEGQLFTGERAVYNLETKKLHAADFRGEVFPFKFYTESLTTLGPKAFMAENATMTTSDSSKPDYFLKARTTRIYSGDRVVFNDVTLYVGKTPVFWFPYLYQSLNRGSGFLFLPGYRSGWGAYLLTQYSFPISENVNGKIHLDLRSKRGAAAGLDIDTKFGPNNRSWGKFTAYYANDSKPETNTTSLVRQTVDSSRYRVSLQSRAYITDDIYASIDINKLSDQYYMQDFLPHKFLTDPQPDNVVSVTKWDENYTITGIARAQLNTFFESTERLPELVLDAKRQSILDSPIFYEGETGVARLNRSFQDGSAFTDYSVTRFDTFHQFLYPKTYFGWLSFIPRVGFRGTYYSATGDSTATLADNTTSATTASSTSTSSTSVLKQGSVFRPVVTAGFESSFKLSRAYDSVQSRTWGLDGIRHVIQPYTNFSYVNTGTNPNEILQFDRLNPSTQIAPLDLSDFNSTDAITDWTIWRWGVRNRFQTRRDNETYNWLDLDSYVDFNLQEAQFPGITYRSGSLSNLYNNLHWNPLPWASLRVDSQVPLNEKGFSEINTYVDFLPTKDLRIDLGHRYIHGNSYFDNSSLITFTGYYRVNDNWAVSASEQYEITDSVLESQTYQIHRDLSSWTASLGFVIRDNRASGSSTANLEYGVLLTFTLKDFPEINAPLSFDPQGASGK